MARRFLLAATVALASLGFVSQPRAASETEWAEASAVIIAYDLLCESVPRRVLFFAKLHLTKQAAAEVASVATAATTPVFCARMRPYVEQVVQSTPQY